MKQSFNVLLLAVLSALAGAVSPQKQWVVSYPEDTPASVIEQAMVAVKKAGGIITHEYNIIKGFAAEATEQALETVQAMGASNNVLIEEDQIVGISND